MNNENDDFTKHDLIPKPGMSTGRVQPPPDIEVIDESLIIGDFDYGQFHPTATTATIKSGTTESGDEKEE